MSVELLEAARAAARAATELLRDVRPDRITSKSNPRDLVTEWDVRSEELIRAVLEEHAPGVPVVGEEGGGNVDAHAVHWLVDPIDGTVNFAHGLPLWSVSIGAVEGGRRLAGVVVVPAIGWWFEARAGGGAFDGTGTPLRVSAIDRVEQALLCTGFPYEMSSPATNNLVEWNHVMKTAAVRRLGSAAIDLCLVARGAFDGFWEQRLSAWDLAAGVLIVEEAGGTVTDMTGAPFDLSVGQVLATNGAIHNGLIAELRRARMEPT